MSAPGYGAVPTEENPSPAEARRKVPSSTDGDSLYARSWRAFYSYLEGGEINDSYRVALLQRKPQNGIPYETVNIHAESVRQLAYFAFWFMMVASKIFSWWLLCDFQPEDQCPIINESDLKDMFGYNNVCVYFDYSPAREIIAMIFPLFEYGLFLYVVFDYIHLRLASPNVPGTAKWLQTMGTIFLPIKIFLIAWFRMIFVYQVDGMHGGIRGVVGHTMSFFGLQIALILVAFENILYVNLTNISYPWLGLRKTKILSWVYLAFFVPNSIFQMAVVFSIFWDHMEPILNVAGDNPNPTHIMIFYLSDRLFLVLVAILPLWFSHMGRKTQAYIKVTMELDAKGWRDETGEETAVAMGK